MCSLSLDYLSWCPSLIDIFCLVDHSDIRNCKLVNRRVRDLIRRNDIIMPRKILQKVILCNKFIKKGEPEDSIYIHFQEIYMKTDRYAKADLLIMKDRIVIHRCDSGTFKRHFKENGMLIDGGTNPTNDISCAVDGLEDGLRLVLSVILRRYHLEELIISMLPMAHWCDLIADKFKTCRSSSKLIKLHYTWPNLEKFRKIMGFREVTTFNFSALGSLVDFDCIWKLRIIIYLRINDILFDDAEPLNDVFESLIKLVKKWLDGVIRIKGLSVRGRYSYRKKLKKKVLSYFKFLPGPDGTQFALRRTSDDAVLRFTFCSRAIEIEDQIVKRAEAIFE